MLAVVATRWVTRLDVLSCPIAARQTVFERGLNELLAMQKCDVVGWSDDPDAPNSRTWLPPKRVAAKRYEPHRIRFARLPHLGSERRGKHGSKASDESATVHYSMI